MRPTDRTEGPMSAVEYDMQARRQVKTLLHAERRRTGHKLAVVREKVARDLGTLPGTLENIGKGRIKGVRGWLRERINQMVLREIEAEIARLEAEKTMLVASGHHLAGEQMGEVDTHIAAVKALLNSGRAAE